MRYFGIVLVPLVVVPGLVLVVVPVPGTLVAPAGPLVVPPAGVVFVPPAGGSPELKSPEAPRFIVPELFAAPAVEAPVAEAPLLRLMPGLPTAFGLLSVPPVVPLLLFECPAVLVLFVPATVPVGTAGVPWAEPGVMLVPLTEAPALVVPVFVPFEPAIPVPVAPGVVEGTAGVPRALAGVMLVPFVEVPALVVPDPWIPALVLVLAAPGLVVLVVVLVPVLVVLAPVVLLDVALAPGESDPAPDDPVELIPGEEP